jgi:HlyD family secretion protein
MERQMSQARITERPRGPDLSGLKIDERQRRDSRRRRWPRAFAVGLGAVLMVSAAVVFILRDKTPVVEVATVREDRGGRSALLNASGYITPRQRATIAAKITGRVNAIFAEEGVHVQPGQVLATLDDVDARARLASVGADRDATAAALGDLRVNLANAERELWRMEVLRARELVSQQDRDQARIAAASPRARIGLASAPANRCRLREL